MLHESEAVSRARRRDAASLVSESPLTDATRRRGSLCRPSFSVRHKSPGFSLRSVYDLGCEIAIRDA